MKDKDYMNGNETSAYLLKSVEGYATFVHDNSAKPFVYKE